MVSRLLQKVLCLLTVILLSTAAGAQKYEAIKLATQNWPPYQMQSDGKLEGVAMDLVVCALNGVDRPYEIHITNWKQAQLGTETGKYDGFFVGSKTLARSRFSTPSDPVITEYLAWYMLRTTDIDPNNKMDALHARYSAKFATPKWLELKRNGYNTVKKPQDAETLLNMLQIGDIDVALEYERIFEFHMVQRGIPLGLFTKIRNRREDLSVHLSKRFLRGNPLFLNKFNEELQICKGNPK